MVIFFSVVGVLLVVALAVSLKMYLQFFGRCDVKPYLAKEDLVKARLDPFADMILPAEHKLLTISPEDIYIDAYDGIKLHGAYYTVDDPKGTLMLVHGWRSSGVNDFSCIIFEYMAMGYNVLLVSQRAHGKSGGKYICMGAKEKYDCKAWTEYLAQRMGEDHGVVLDGISMGGATVLKASGLGLPKNVKGIIADSSFTHARGVIKELALANKIPPYPALWLFELWFRVLGGCSMGESALDAIKNNTIPLLLLHGEADDFVPCYMTRQIHDAATCKKTLFTVPEANHGLSYLCRKEECTKLLNEFLADVLG